MSIGNGVVGVLQAMVLVKAQLAPSQEPSIPAFSNPSSSEASWVSCPNFFAASWSIVVAAITFVSVIALNGTQVR